MKNKQDELVQSLIALTEQKKKAIAKAEKPSWQTNCSFSFNPEGSNRINIQTVGELDVLSRMLGFLIQMKDSHDQAIIKLGLTLPFKWMGFTLQEWENDFITRVDKIQITQKKKELTDLQTRLDKLISPELKAKMELEDIQKMLE